MDAGPSEPSPSPGGDAPAADGELVRLHLYDISHGLAQRFSPILLGQQVEGLWHVGLAVGEEEWTYGPPVTRYPAGNHPRLGNPAKVIELGFTGVLPSTRHTLIAELEGAKYRPEQYNLLYNNCTTFASDLAELLTGNTLPEEVVGQAQAWLSGPVGELLLGFAGGPGGSPAPGATAGAAAPPASAGATDAGPSTSAAAATAGVAAAGTTTGIPTAAGGDGATGTGAAPAGAPGRTAPNFAGLQQLLRELLAGGNLPAAAAGANPMVYGQAVQQIMGLVREAAEAMGMAPAGAWAGAGSAGGEGAGGGDGTTAAPAAGEPTGGVPQGPLGGGVGGGAPAATGGGWGAAGSGPAAAGWGCGGAGAFGGRRPWVPGGGPWGRGCGPFAAGFGPWADARGCGFMPMGQAGGSGPQAAGGGGTGGTAASSGTAGAGGAGATAGGAGFCGWRGPGCCPMGGGSPAPSAAQEGGVRVVIVPVVVLPGFGGMGGVAEAMGWPWLSQFM